MSDKSQQKKNIENWTNYVFDQEGLDDLDLSDEYVDNLRESFVDMLRERYNDLVNCDRYSMYTSVRYAARLGVLLSGRYNEAYLVAFGNNVSLILDYKGLVKVAKKSPEVVDVNASVIYSNDDYRIDEMNPEDSYHRRVFVQRGDRVGAWAKIFKEDGPGFVRALDQDQIQKVKEQSDNKSLWEQHTNEMWAKTAIRNAMKMVDLPHQTAKVLEAIENDDPDYEELPDEDESEHAQTIQGNEGVQEKLSSDDSEEKDNTEEKSSPGPDEKPDTDGGNQQRRIDMARKIAIEVLDLANEHFEKIKDDVDAAKHLLNKMKKAKEDEEYLQELKAEYVEEEEPEEDEGPDVPDNWEADIGEYHTGNGWHLFPDDERVRGTSKAEQYRMNNKPGADAPDEQPASEDTDESSSDEEEKSDVEEMEERFEEPEEEDADEGDDDELGDLECEECGGDIANESVRDMAVEEYGRQLCAGCAMDAKKE
jgi:phage RecT family recombinase